MVKRIVKRCAAYVARHLPGTARLLAERETLLRGCGFVPPGHFYSPLPDFDQSLRTSRLWSVPAELSGIDLREADQLALFDDFVTYYHEQPFSAGGRRYYFENPMFSHADGLTLYCMMRHVRPQRIIEVGSGFSSALMLDTNELFFDGRIQCTFIEPHPDRLLSVLRAEDRNRITLLASPVQHVDRALFATLEANDMLFIDSSHVAKIGSDVVYLLTEVLPTLAAGVYVHVHDVPYPFEYFREWVAEGRAWNEAYMVRAFLTFNYAYRIVFFNTYLEHFHRDRFEAEMPLFLHNTGASLWLQRIA